MNGVTKDISKSALSIQTIGQLVKLSKGQHGLLKLIRQSVQENKPLDWDALVQCFYDNVSCKIHDWRWIGEFNKGHREYYSLDLLEEYKKQSIKWQYHAKSRVRQWFVSTIGILVVKGQLFVIPTIELE